MIRFIRGEVINKNKNFITILCGQIGYRVFVLPKLLEQIKIKQTTELHTHLRHKDDSMDLYGFKQLENLEFFELLLTISGVGPKSALGILEVASLTQIKKAILRDDASILYKVSGVGKKTAERIVVELKNKLDNLPVTEKEIALTDDETEIFDALVSLGYQEKNIRQALKQLPVDINKTDEKIKFALKYLGGKH